LPTLEMSAVIEKLGAVKRYVENTAELDGLVVQNVRFIKATEREDAAG
jgi:hypothetical protein